MDKPNNWFVNLLGWLAFIGLFATGVLGLIGGAVRSDNPQLAGALYLLIGGAAFALVLALVLRRNPTT